MLRVKIKLIFITNPNVRIKTIKFLEENIENLSDVEFTKEFLNITQKALIIKDKSNQVIELYKIEILLSQSTVNKMKKQVQLGGKYLQVIYLTKDLYSKKKKKGLYLEYMRSSLQLKLDKRFELVISAKKV